jgi:hypothetical protein
MELKYTLPKKYCKTVSFTKEEKTGILIKSTNTGEISEQVRIEKASFPCVGKTILFPYKAKHYTAWEKVIKKKGYEVFYVQQDTKNRHFGTVLSSRNFYMCTDRTELPLSKLVGEVTHCSNIFTNWLSFLGVEISEDDLLICF